MLIDKQLKIKALHDFNDIKLIKNNEYDVFILFDGVYVMPHKLKAIIIDENNNKQFFGQDSTHPGTQTLSRSIVTANRHYIHSLFSCQILVEVWQTKFMAQIQTWAMRNSPKQVVVRKSVGLDAECSPVQI